MRLKNNPMIKVSYNLENGKWFELPYLKIVGEFRDEIKRVCGEKYKPRVYSIFSNERTNKLVINFALIDTTKKSKRVVISDIAFYLFNYSHISKTPFFFQDKIGDPENSCLSTKNVLWESQFANIITAEEFGEIVKTL